MTRVSQRQRIYDYIRNRGILGATDDELMVVLDLMGNSVHPRRGELMRDGLICESGAMRETRMGGQAIVWVAREFIQASAVANG